MALACLACRPCELDFWCPFCPVGTGANVTRSRPGWRGRHVRSGRWWMRLCPEHVTNHPGLSVLYLQALCITQGKGAQQRRVLSNRGVERRLTAPLLGSFEASERMGTSSGPTLRLHLLSFL